MKNSYKNSFLIKIEKNLSVKATLFDKFIIKAS
jgi:hypothetical protein